MRAAVCTRYGAPDVLVHRHVPKPVPESRDMLVRVVAATVSAADRRIRSLDVPAGFKSMMRLFFGLNGPRQPILGTEFSGEIEAVGNKVTRFKAGDRVIVSAGVKMGGYAEYACIREDRLIAIKPEGMSFAEAAALPFGGLAVLDFFRRAKLKPGERILVFGASGAVGSAAVQLARHFSLSVTAVCSTVNVEWVGLLGAEHVIDYTREDFLDSGKTYDAILDTTGTLTYSRCRLALKPAGRFLAFAAGLPEILGAPWVSLTRAQAIISGSGKVHDEDMQLLVNLAGQEAFQPVIDRVYTLEAIRDAHAYVDSGRKKGNVVIIL